MKEIGLYVHIPFCLKKCNYCDFTSIKYNEEIVKSYIQGLLKEIEMYRDKLSEYRIKTIFLGGGTPSILKEKYFEKITKSIYENFNTNNVIEFTIESNPGTLSKDKLNTYLELGVNRLSIGLQSFDNNLLQYIGRAHNKEDFIENYYKARECGFNNINVDLMYGLPGQSIEDWKNTLIKIAELYPEHISAYSLKIEEGTKFYELNLQNKLKTMEDDSDRVMHHYCIDFLKKHNIFQYEISNFSKKDFQCKHNMIYWNNNEYIGLGVAAHSYIDGRRFSNTKSIKKYYNKLNNNIFPISDEENLSTQDEIFETIFLGLRMTKGLDIERFKKRFGISIFSIYEREINKLIKLELIKIEDERLMLTRYGMDVSNQVFSEFVIN